jgi:ribosomal protein L24
MAEGDLVAITRGGFHGSVGRIERLVNEKVALVTVPRLNTHRDGTYWSFSQYYLMRANLEVAS